MASLVSFTRIEYTYDESIVYAPNLLGTSQTLIHVTPAGGYAPATLDCSETSTVSNFTRSPAAGIAGPLLAILAALATIGSAAIYQQRETRKAAEAAARAARFFNSSNMTPRNAGKRRRRSARRWSRTRNDIILPQQTKARPGVRTFPRPHRVRVPL